MGWKKRSRAIITPDLPKVVAPKFGELVNEHAHEVASHWKPYSRSAFDPAEEQQKALERAVELFLNNWKGKVVEEPFTLEGLADAVHEATRRWEEKDSIFRKARDVVLKVTDKLGSFQVLFSIFPDQSIYTASLCKAVKALFVAAESYKDSISGFAEGFSDILDSADLVSRVHFLFPLEDVQKQVAVFYSHVLKFYCCALEWFRSSSFKKFWNSLAEGGPKEIAAIVKNVQKSAGHIQALGNVIHMKMEQDMLMKYSKCEPVDREKLENVLYSIVGNIETAKREILSVVVEEIERKFSSTGRVSEDADVDPDQEHRVGVSKDSLELISSSSDEDTDNNLPPPPAYNKKEVLDLFQKLCGLGQYNVDDDVRTARSYRGTGGSCNPQERLHSWLRESESSFLWIQAQQPSSSPLAAITRFTGEFVRSAKFGGLSIICHFCSLHRSGGGGGGGGGGGKRSPIISLLNRLTFQLLDMQEEVFNTWIDLTEDGLTGLDSFDSAWQLFEELCLSRLFLTVVIDSLDHYDADVHFTQFLQQIQALTENSSGVAIKLLITCRRNSPVLMRNLPGKNCIRFIPNQKVLWYGSNYLESLRDVTGYRPGSVCLG